MAEKLQVVRGRQDDADVAVPSDRYTQVVILGLVFNLVPLRVQSVAKVFVRLRQLLKGSTVSIPFFRASSTMRSRLLPVRG